jgi:putative NADH-flavin reductase
MGHSATWQQVRATSALPPQSRHTLTRSARQFGANNRRAARIDAAAENCDDSASSVKQRREISMRIVLLGATGFVGSALLVEALHRGHKVTAIVRHPEKLEKRDGLTATAGDVYDTDSLASLIAGHDALISAFNPGWTPGTVKPEMYDEQVRGTSSIIAAARKAGIKRVLWVGGAGGLEVAPGVQSIDAPGFPEWIKPGSRATSDALEQLQKLPELDWSFLAPSAKLEPGQRTGKFRLGGDQLLVDANGESRISVQDYAVAMIDELERPAHIRQRFTVGY